MQENVEKSPSLLAGERTAPIVERPCARLLPTTNPDFSINRLYYHSDAARPRLRIGVMVNGSSAQFFMRKILEDVRNCDFANLVAVIANCEPAVTPAPRLSLPARMLRSLIDGDRRSGLFYLAYLRRLDRRYRSQPDPCAAVDCSDLFAEAQRIEASPIRNGFVDRIPPDALEQIRALDLDVILRFGFRIIRGDALTVARYGVWSFHHGDSERYRGGPALLWELMEGNPLSGAVLQRLDETLDAGPVLCRALLATCPRPSVSMNRFNVYWSTQHFAIQKLYELHRFGIGQLARRTVRPGAYLGKRAIYRRPTNSDMARWLAPTLMRTALRKLAARKEVIHWRMGLRKSAAPLHKEPRTEMLSEFSWIDSPRGRFWADPFLLEEGADTWLFFEDFMYAEKRGVIACGKVEDGRVIDVRKVLERPHHLSWPHVFRHDGAVWMIPESSQARQVQLYRATRFPDEWVLERTLLDLSAVDPSAFEFHGCWWMFVSPLVVNGHAPFTLLFTAPQPWGPWTLHPAGSVCSDVRWARCAGAIIREGDRLVRPSQDCSAGYGHSICFNEVRELSDSSYEEERRAQLLPDPRQSIFGVHTYNRAGEWEVIDARTLTPKARVM